jgi:hypothetical protein
VSLCVGRFVARTSVKVADVPEGTMFHDLCNDALLELDLRT